MARRGMPVLAATVLAVLAAPAVPASAGGGCASGATTGTGDTVELVDMCFTPTTLRIAPGDSVTFVNEDPFVHTIGGNGWGRFEDLAQGDTFTATFDEPGVYPYACIYHPGMTGAIVVGDGTGSGNGATVSVTSFQPPAPSPEVVVRTVGSSAGGGAVAIGWIGGVAIGLAFGIGGGLALRRRSAGAQGAVT